MRLIYNKERERLSNTGWYSMLLDNKGNRAKAKRLKESGVIWREYWVTTSIRDAHDIEFYYKGNEPN